MSSSKDKKPKLRSNLSRCDVRSCDRQRNIAMHTLPSTSNAKMRKVWISQLKLTSPLKKDHYYVCGNHFRSKDYKEVSASRSRRILKRTAIPSLNLPTSSDESNTMIDHEVTMDAFSNGNELNVQVNVSRKGEPLSLEIASVNELAEKINDPYKRKPWSELGVASGGELTTNDEFILGL